MLDPFEKTRCSFPVPDFRSDDEERDWSRSLTTEQGFELLHWMQVHRWGEEAVNRPMDRTVIEKLTWEQFNERKRIEDLEEDEWRKQQGLPPRYSRT